MSVLILIASVISPGLHSAEAGPIDVSEENEEEENFDDLESSQGSKEETSESFDGNTVQDDWISFDMIYDALDLLDRDFEGFEEEVGVNERVDEDNKTTEDTDKERSDEDTTVEESDDDEEILDIDTEEEHELILDYYDIVFEENMTALTTEANHSVYRIEIGGEILTADEIRDHDDTDDLVENIEENITDGFVKTISSAFPDADKEFYDAESTEGDSGPINFSNSADVYLTKTSLGFDEDNEELNMSDVVKGTLQLGANVSKDVDLNVEEGHNSTFRFKVPPPYLMESEDTWGEWGDENYTWDNEEERISTWIFNNTKGDQEVVLEREWKTRHEDPDEVEREDIHTESLFDMKSFDNVPIENTINVSSASIEEYTKEDTDEPILPDHISDLEIVTSDGLRLFLDNDLVTLDEIKDRSLDDSIAEMEANIENMFGEEPDMELEWDHSTVSGYDIEEMGEEPPLRSYVNSTEPIGFTNEKLDLPEEADKREVINETLRVDAMIKTDSEFTAEEGVVYDLNVLSPRKIKFEDSEPVGERYLYEREIDNRDGETDITTLSLKMRWAGEVRTYEEEDVEAYMLMDMERFDHVPIKIWMDTRVVDPDRYGDEFEISENVHELDLIDYNFIRMSIRNDMVELSTIYDETVKPSEEDISSGLKDLFGEEVELDWEWESLHWKDWSHAEWEELSPELDEFGGEFESVEPAAFDNDVFDLPEEADLGEMVRATLQLNATIKRDFTVETEEYVDNIISLKTPEDIKIVGGEKGEDRWSREYELEGDESEATTTWRYDGEIREVNQEDISVVSDFDLEDLENIDLDINISVSWVDPDDYDFDISEDVEDLDYVDHQFLRTAVENDILEWKTITDEMNNSVEEVKDQIPGFIGDVEFEYNDPGRLSGPIIRHYRVEDFQLEMPEEDMIIDNEFAESLMRSGAVIDFSLSDIDEEEGRSKTLKLSAPDFMRLYDPSGEVPKEDGYYKIDLGEDFNGEFCSNVEVPSEQSATLDIDVTLERASLKTDLFDMDYSASADTLIEGDVSLSVVEAPAEMKDSLPEDIYLEYATADLMRQAEKRGLFEKEEILDMIRDGQGIEDFEGISKALEDAIDGEDLEVELRFKEGSWDLDDKEAPIVILMDSEFNLPLKETGSGVGSFNIYSIGMGEIEIPSIDGVDTNFRIIFPSGIRPDVDENENVKIGETSGSRHYLEVDVSDHSEEQITIEPDIVITSGIFFSMDIFLHGIPLLIITSLIILLVVLVVVLKVVPVKELMGKKSSEEDKEEYLEDQEETDEEDSEVGEDEEGIQSDGEEEIEQEEESVEEEIEQEDREELDKDEKEVDDQEGSEEEKL